MPMWPRASMDLCETFVDSLLETVWLHLSSRKVHICLNLPRLLQTTLSFMSAAVSLEKLSWSLANLKQCLAKSKQHRCWLLGWRVSCGLQGAVLESLGLSDCCRSVFCCGGTARQFLGKNLGPENADQRLAATRSCDQKL